MGRDADADVHCLKPGNLSVLALDHALMFPNSHAIQPPCRSNRRDVQFSAPFISDAMERGSCESGTIIFCEGETMVGDTGLEPVTSTV